MNSYPNAYELSMRDCTRLTENCPVIERVFELDSFLEALGVQIEPRSKELREMLGDFVTACVKDYCPGKNPSIVTYIRRSDQ